MTARAFDLADDGLPPATAFVGHDFLSTFGNCEMELMAAEIVSYCADKGSWDLQPFEFDRLADLADLIDAEVMNGHVNNGLCRDGLASLRHYAWITKAGVTPHFVQRLAQSRSRWQAESAIGKRCTEAVTVIMRARARLADAAAKVTP